MAKIKYKKGDIVVFRRDVCKVVNIAKSDFTGEKCYVMVPYLKQDGSVKMQVPVSNKAGHLRDLSTKEEILGLIKMVNDVETIESKPANMKSQYAALLKTDDIKDLICIMKTTYIRNRERMLNNKKPASVDHEYFEKAEYYLFNEIAVVLDMSYDEAKAYFTSEVEKQAS